MDIQLKYNDTVAKDCQCQKLFSAALVGRPILPVFKIASDYIGLPTHRSPCILHNYRYVYLSSLVEFQALLRQQQRQG